MKIIVAGCVKTGTKSLTEALTKLDYNVYNYMEHFWFHREQWERFFEGKGKVEDFRQMYEDVDVVCDGPISFFWEEIFSVYPDAKIILTVRDNEDQWFESRKRHVIRQSTNITWKLIHLFSPIGRTFHRYRRTIYRLIYGGNLTSLLSNTVLNEIVQRRHYRQQITYVPQVSLSFVLYIQKVPKDQLLIYNVKEGWEPLCKFLGVETPDEPFPHKNKLGEVYEVFLKECPKAQRMQKEMYISVSILFALTAVAGSFALTRVFR
ncbi:uncharacterized protein LOC144744175 [Ciona intestinalis]